MQRAVQWIIFIIMLTMNSTSHAALDPAMVSLNFRLSHVATQQTAKGADDIRRIPYRKIRAFYERFRRQSNLTRTIHLDWQIVNFQATNDLYFKEIPGLSDKPSGYHLFDIAWYTPRFSIEYRDHNTRRWETVYALAAGFRIEVSSEATIKGYGNVPVYTVPGIQMQPDNKPHVVNGLSETLAETMTSDDYRAVAIWTPVVKSVYANIPTDARLPSKVEMFGTLLLGSSGVHTARSPLMYPLDSYLFNVIARCRYPAVIRSSVGDVEDLESIGTVVFSSRVAAWETAGSPFEFRRRDVVRSVVLPVALLLFSMLTKFVRRRLLRLAFYCAYGVFLHLSLRPPLNIPRFNILSICAWSVFLLLITIIEIKKSEGALFAYLSAAARRTQKALWGILGKPIMRS